MEIFLIYLKYSNIKQISNRKYFFKHFFGDASNSFDNIANFCINVPKLNALLKSFDKVKYMPEEKQKDIFQKYKEV